MENRKNFYNDSLAPATLEYGNQFRFKDDQMGMRISTLGGRGAELESLITISQRGIICVSKMTAGIRWTRDKGPLPAKGPVDYVGCVCGTGRAICFDAKQSNEARGFPLGKIERHQLDYLSRHGRAGAIAGILVGATHHSVEAYLWLDWEDIPANLCGSVAWENEDVWVECGRWGGVVDWGRLVGTPTSNRKHN